MASKMLTSKKLSVRSTIRLGWDRLTVFRMVIESYHARVLEFANR